MFSSFYLSHLSHGLASLSLIAVPKRPRINLVAFPALLAIVNNNKITMNSIQSLSPALSTWPHITRRFFHLLLIFLPSLLLSPLYFVSPLRWIWLKVFAKSIQMAGVAWIKLFQFLSHRGDMVGSEMAQIFVYLRQSCPKHSIEETKNIFKKAYGVQLQEYFSDINPEPIASGSVSQVYQAVLNGKKVAVKVRHPSVHKNINADIQIGIMVSKFLSFFSSRFSIPLNEKSLKKMLNDQLDFTRQQNNLNTFRKLIKNNSSVNFPWPFPGTSQAVLIMDFVQGKSITHYQQKQDPMNKYIAKLTGLTFFQMLIQHNFLHADYHGGNIIVQIKEIEPGFLTWLKWQWEMGKNAIWNSTIKLGLNSKLLKNLCDDEQRQELLFKRQMLELGKSVKISLIDVGMVLSLQKHKRNHFISFLSQIISGNAHKSAEMIHQISKDSKNEPLKRGQHQEYLKDLETVFSFIQDLELKQVQGVEVLNAMLGMIRKHKMRLDGQFASLLSNMLMVEQIMQGLYPGINVMRCIVPYLPYQ